MHLDGEFTWYHRLIFDLPQLPQLLASWFLVDIFWLLFIDSLSISFDSCFLNPCWYISILVLNYFPIYFDFCFLIPCRYLSTFAYLSSSFLLSHIFCCFFIILCIRYVSFYSFLSSLSPLFFRFLLFHFYFIRYFSNCSFFSSLCRIFFLRFLIDGWLTLVWHWFSVGL